MITLEHLLLEQRVLEAEFSCDLARCKGACCTMSGGAGAPVKDDEVDSVREAVNAAMPYLSDRSKVYLQEHGPLEGTPGNWATACIDNKACVFVKFEGDVATCAIEKAFHAGESSFRKPISCHLFPIRIADFGGPYLHYEQFDECGPGREKGKADGTRLVESVSSALSRAYGEEIAAKIISISDDEEGESGLT